MNPTGPEQRERVNLGTVRRGQTVQLQNFSGPAAIAEAESALAATVGSYGAGAGGPAMLAPVPLLLPGMRFPPALPLTPAPTAPDNPVYFRELREFLRANAEGPNTISYGVVRVVRGRSFYVTNNKVAAACDRQTFVKGVVPGAVLGVALKIVFRGGSKALFQEGDGRDRGFGTGAPFFPRARDDRTMREMKEFLKANVDEMRVHVRYLGPRKDHVMAPLGSARCEKGEDFDSCMKIFQGVQANAQEVLKNEPSGVYDLYRSDSWPLLQYEIAEAAAGTQM